MSKNPIPDFQSLMLPLLQLLSDGKEHSSKELVASLCDEFALTEEQRAEPLPSGTQPIIANRIGWARTYMSKAGLIAAPRRAIFKITDEGQRILLSNPDKINVKYLNQLPGFKEWHNYKSKDGVVTVEIPDEIESKKTPLELLEESHRKIKDQVAFELLEKVKQSSPSFFENLVVELLLRMGYGGSQKDAGEVKGKSGDGGIDGLIKEDKLGLDVIYIQAKRWEGTVTISSVRDFAGALLAKKAKKGIFITTSSFPQSAFEFTNDIEHRIVLIDGKHLAKLMIDYNVGVNIAETYEIKRLDLDFFDEL